jgi:hypothetical protein
MKHYSDVKLTKNIAQKQLKGLNNATFEFVESASKGVADLILTNV